MKLLTLAALGVGAFALFSPRPAAKVLESVTGIVLPGINYSNVNALNQSEVGYKNPALVAVAASPQFQYYIDKFGNSSFTLDTWANPLSAGVHPVYG